MYPLRRFYIADANILITINAFLFYCDRSYRKQTVKMINITLGYTCPSMSMVIEPCLYSLIVISLSMGVSRR